MGKFGLFDTAKEDKAFELIFRKRKPVEEVLKELEENDMPMTLKDILDFKEHAFEVMKQNEKREALADYFLDSYKRIKIDFDWMVDETKGLIEKAKGEGSDFKQLMGLKEMHQQIKTTLTKMGKLQGDAKILKNEGQMINTQNVMVLMRGMQDNWFRENGAELKDGKIIFNDPKSEIMDNFNSWKRKEAAHMQTPGIHVVK